MGVLSVILLLVICAVPIVIQCLLASALGHGTAMILQKADEMNENKDLTHND